MKNIYPNGTHFVTFIHVRVPDTAHLPKVVVKATAKKECIIACFSGEEGEVIVIPQNEGDLSDIKVVEEGSKGMKKIA